MLRFLLLYFLSETLLYNSFYFSAWGFLFFPVSSSLFWVEYHSGGSFFVLFCSPASRRVPPVFHLWCKGMDYMSYNDAAWPLLCSCFVPLAESTLPCIYLCLPICFCFFSCRIVLIFLSPFSLPACSLLFRFASLCPSPLQRRTCFPTGISFLHKHTPTYKKKRKEIRISRKKKNARERKKTPH